MTTHRARKETCAAVEYKIQISREQQIWKEGNVLFNDALYTFYLRLYGVGYMVKDHSNSERGNPLHPHRLLFPISSIIHRRDNTYHRLCYTSRGALAGTRRERQRWKKRQERKRARERERERERGGTPFS